MGVVYKAHDTKLDRTVALKFLPPHLTKSEEDKQRFIREAKAAAALNHPHICTIYNVDEHDGDQFIVIEYVDGVTLRDKMNASPLTTGGLQGGLSIDTAISYTIQIAEALDEAHTKGIVHRDIKPENIMIDSKDRIKVMDFGLAKLKGTGNLTKSGSTVGTMAYMSPEQIQGQEVDHRSDIFSFGIVFFEMLTGIRPFRGDHEAALMYSIVNEEPSSLRSYMSNPPEELVHLFDELLAKEPDVRLSSSTELMASLDALRTVATTLERQGTADSLSPAHSEQDEDGSSTTISIALPGGGLWEISFGGMSLWVGTLALLAVVLLVGWWFVGSDVGADQIAVEELEPDRVAVFPFAVRGAEELDYLGEGMVELMSRSLDGAGTLTTVDPMVVLSRTAREFSTEVLGPEEARSIAAGFGAGRFVLGSILRVGEEIHLSGRWYGTDGEELGGAEVRASGEAEILFSIDALAREAISVLVGDGTDLRDRLAAETTSSVQALKAYLEGQAAYRSQDWSAAYEAFERAVAEDPDFALAHYRLSQAAGFTDSYVSLESARRAVELSEALPERDRLLIKANSAYVQGRPETAERLYRQIVDTYPGDVEAWYMLGEVLFHFSRARGRSATDARLAFETALRLDPAANEALYHLIDIAAIERDTTLLDSLTTGLEQRNLTPQNETAFRIARHYLLDESSEFKFNEQNPPAVRIPAFVLMLWGDFHHAKALFRTWTDPARPLERQVTAHRHIHAMLVAQGQLDAAREALQSIAQLDSAVYVMERARLATLPFLPEGLIDYDEQLELLEQISALDPDDIDGQIEQLYLTGLLHAALEDREGALEAADSLKEMEPPALSPSGPSDLARGIEAELAHLDNRPEQALQHLEALEFRGNPTMIHITLNTAVRERFLRAELLAEDGRFKEALGWYNTFDGYFGVDLHYLGTVHRGRARVLEKLGRTEETIEAHERFLELWENADPVFELMSEEARKRLEHLTG